ncbi:F-box/LRR-repeat protein At5g02910-like [Henckelia pumila]|uniref:F-box/LRR-repeat protein At5g02910-like n=1 Tax=Henckelia pumila TaxID=405737 RepID=UPI003C6E8356
MMEDRISQLPDKVISSIISRLLTKDAVRTSILSRRWRHVYTIIDQVRFTCYDKLSSAACCPILGEEKSRQLQRKFVQGVDTFLQNHSGSKVSSFELVCCFRGRHMDSFRKWMNFVGTSGVEKLTLEYCCLNYMLSNGPHVFSTDFLTGASSVKHLWLQCGSFQTPNKNALEVLEFDNVSFTSDAVGCMLSNCSSLRLLNLRYCSVPSKLQIHGPDLQLKCLIIYYCKDVEEIDLSASNLIDFEIFSPNIPKLSFSHVPLLQSVVIEYSRKQATSPQVLGKLAKDLPQLESMVFTTSASFFEELKLDRVISKLSNLRRLVLMLEDQHKLDLLELTTFLDACPLLHKFQLSMPFQGTFNRKKAKERMARRFTPLKVLEFNGFREAESEYDFILYILKTVASLERLLISRSTLWYEPRLRRWTPSLANPLNPKLRHGIIQKRLQGQAVSNDVEIIIS